MDSLITFLFLIVIFIAVNKSKAKNKKAGVKPPPGPAAMPEKLQEKPVAAPEKHRSEPRWEGFGTKPCEHKDDAFAGSMKVDSAEGKDFGHVHSNAKHGHNPLPAMPAVMPSGDEEHDGLELDFSDGDQLVRAFVMQEILRRPGR